MSGGGCVASIATSDTEPGPGSGDIDCEGCDRSATSTARRAARPHYCRSAGIGHRHRGGGTSAGAGFDGGGNPSTGACRPVRKRIDRVHRIVEWPAEHSGFVKFLTCQVVVPGARQFDREFGCCLVVRGDEPVAGSLWIDAFFRCSEQCTGDHDREFRGDRPGRNSADGGTGYPAGCGAVRDRPGDSHHCPRGAGDRACRGVAAGQRNPPQALARYTNARRRTGPSHPSRRAIGGARHRIRGRADHLVIAN